MRALLLVNPKSRSGSDASERASEALKKAGITVVPAPSDALDDCGRAIRDAKGSIDAVIVGGGDGTVRLALSATLECGLPLGVLPLGTSNNLARNLNIPTDLEAAIACIAAGNTRTIDVGFVNDEPFLNVVGIGLSTEVNRTIPKESKRRWGPLAYVFHAIKVARRFRPFHAFIRGDETSKQRVRSLQITVCNGRYYGAAMVIADDATIQDGRLDLISTQITHWWQALPLVPAYLRGAYEGKRRIRLLQGSHFVIETRRPLLVDVDGDPLLRTPLSFRVRANALRVFAPPRQVAGTLSAELRQ